MQWSNMLLHIFLCLTFVVALSNVQGRPASEDSENDGTTYYYYTMDSMEESGSNYEMSDDSSWSYSSSGTSWNEGQSDDEFSSSRKWERDRRAEGQSSQTKEISYESEGSSKGGSGGGGNNSGENTYSSAGGYEETFRSSQESMSEEEYSSESRSGSHRHRSSSMSRTDDENGINNGGSQSTDVAKAGNKNKKNSSSSSVRETSRTSEEENTFDSSSSSQTNERSSRKSTSMTRRGMNDKNNDSDDDDDKKGNIAGKQKPKGGSKGDGGDSDKKGNEPIHGKPGKDKSHDDHSDEKQNDNGNKPKHDGKKPKDFKDKPKAGNKKPSDKTGNKKKPHKPGDDLNDHSSEEDDSSETAGSSSRHTHHHHESSEKYGHGGKPGDKKPKHKPGENPSDDDNKNGEKPKKPSDDNKDSHGPRKKPGHPNGDENKPGKKPTHPKDDGKKPDHQKVDHNKKPKHGKPSKDMSDEDESEGEPNDNGNKSKHNGKKPQDSKDKPKSGGKKKKPHKAGDDINDHSSEEDDSSESPESNSRHTHHHHESRDKYGLGRKAGDKKPEYKRGDIKPSDDDEDDDNEGKSGTPSTVKKVKNSNGDSNESDVDSGKSYKCMLRERDDSPRKGSKSPSNGKNRPKGIRKPEDKNDIPDDEHDTSSYRSSEEDDIFESSETPSRHTQYRHKTSNKSSRGEKPGNKVHKRKTKDKISSDSDDEDESDNTPNDDDEMPGKKPTHSKDGHNKKPKPNKPGKPIGKDTGDKPKDDRRKLRDSKDKPNGESKKSSGKPSEKETQRPPRKGNKSPSNGKNHPKDKKPTDKKDMPNDEDDTSFYRSSEEDDIFESSETGSRHTQHRNKTSHKSGRGEKPGNKIHKRKPGDKISSDSEDEDESDNTPNDDDETPGKMPTHPKDGHKKEPKPNKPGKPIGKDTGDKPNDDRKKPRDSNDKPNGESKKPSDKPSKNESQRLRYRDNEYSSEEDDSSESFETISQHSRHNRKFSDKSGHGGKHRDKKPKHKPGNKKPFDDDGNKEIGKKPTKPSHDNKSPNDMTPGRKPSHSKNGRMKKPKSGKDNGKNPRDSKDKPKERGKKPSDEPGRKKPQKLGVTDSVYSSEEDDSFESSETENQHKSDQHESSSKYGREKKPKYPKQMTGDENASNENDDDENTKPKHNGKTPSKGNKRHPHLHTDEDNDSNYSSAEDESSENSVKNHKDRRHRHNSNIQKVKHGDKHSTRKRGTKISLDEENNNTMKQGKRPSKHHENNKPDKHKDSNKKGKNEHHKNKADNKTEDKQDRYKIGQQHSKHDKTPSQKPEHPKHKKHVHRKDNNDSEDSGEEQTGKKGKRLKHRNDYKKPGQDKRTQETDKNKHKPSKHGKKPEKHHRRSKKTDDDSYHSSEEFDSSDEPENTVRKRHQHRSFDRQGTKDDKKHHGHNKHNDISKNGHKENDDKKKPKHKHDNRREKVKHWDRKEDSSDSDEADKKKSKHPRYQKDHKWDKTGEKYRGPGDNEKKAHKTKQPKPNDKEHRDSRHGQKRGDNNQDDIDYELKYKEIRKFIKNLTFEKIQGNEKLQKKFYKHFKFNVKSKSVFRFIKFCYLYSKTPNDFGKHFAPILRIIQQEKPNEVPNDYYKKFIIKVFGNNKQDFGKKYDAIRKFLYRLKFKDLQTEENMEEFHSYFKFYPQNEKDLKFFQFCFRNPKKPDDFETKFTPIWNVIYRTNSSEVIDKYYNILIYILFGETPKGNPNENGGDDDSDNNSNEDDIDNELKYEEIHNILKDLTFEKYQRSKKIQKNLFKYFRFNVKSKSVFRFIKFCYQYPKVPTGFGKHFSLIFKRILQKKPDKIPDEFYKQFIVKVFSNNKHNIGKNYKKMHKFLKNLKYKDVQTGKKAKTFYRYFKFHPKNENVFKFIKHCFRNPKKPADFDKKFSSILNIILKIDFKKQIQFIDKYYPIFINVIFDKNSQSKDDNNEEGKDGNKDTNENTSDIDYKANYQEIFDFFSSMSFEDLQNEENMRTFYHYFNIECKSESLFYFLKSCFQSSEQPSDFGIIFTTIWKVILNFDMDEIPDMYNAMVTNTLSINNKGYKSNFEDYEGIYNFLINLNYSELQTKENWEKFYTFFGFCPVSESMLDFIKYCFQYPEKPENLETNFQRCITDIFKSNCDVTTKIYIDFAKYLFGESQMNYKENYGEVYKFMKDLTYDKAQEGNYWDTFYYYFQCYPESEGLFNLFKHCYQYEQKPTNFDANFLSVLKVIFNTNSFKDSDVFDKCYSIFDSNLFEDENNNNQQDFGANYNSIYNFIEKLNFDDAQTPENSLKFKRYFNFYPKFKSQFEFIKYCFQYADKPALFEVNFSKALNAIHGLDSEEVPTHLYTQFAKNLFGGENQFYKGNYPEVYKFMKNLKYEDMEIPENWDLFYYYFECYPVSKSLFDFIKFCYRYDEAPVNFETNFQNCLTTILELDDDDVPDDMYIIFIKNLFNGNIYKAIYHFLKGLTFEEVEKPSFRKIFYYYFKFYPKNESRFEFIKYCFQYADKPVNFDKNFQETLGIYLDSGDEEVSDDLREKFMHNLFGDDKSEGQSEWYDFGFNQMFDKSNDDQNDNESNNDNGYSWDNNGNSWSYSWNSGNQGGSSRENQEGNSNSGNDQNNNQYYEWYNNNDQNNNQYYEWYNYN